MLDSETLVRRLVASKAGSPDEIQGCSEAEIEQVCAWSGLPLPAAYLEFLRAIGKGAGLFMCEVEQYYDAILELNDKAREALEIYEDGNLSLPDKAYVFSMRYGEQFLFFIADGVSDNPAIYYYYENDGMFTDLKKTFWDVIESELWGWEDYYNRWKDDSQAEFNTRNQ